MLEGGTAVNTSIRVCYNSNLSTPTVKTGYYSVLPLLGVTLRSSNVSINGPFFIHCYEMGATHRVNPLLGTGIIYILVNRHPKLVASRDVDTCLTCGPRPSVDRDSCAIISGVDGVNVPPIRTTTCVSRIVGGVLTRGTNNLTLGLWGNEGLGVLSTL